MRTGRAPVVTNDLPFNASTRHNVAPSMAVRITNTEPGPFYKDTALEHRQSRNRETKKRAVSCTQKRQLSRLQPITQYQVHELNRQQAEQRRPRRSSLWSNFELHTQTCKYYYYYYYHQQLQSPRPAASAVFPNWKIRVWDKMSNTDKSHFFCFKSQKRERKRGRETLLTKRERILNTNNGLPLTHIHPLPLLHPRYLHLPQLVCVLGAIFST